MNINRLSGLLIFICFIITIISYFFNIDILIYSGIFAWFAMVLLFKVTSNKKLLILLLFLSLLCFLFSFYKDFEIDLKKAVIVNQYLLTLLIGVGFLRLVATPKEENIKELPSGKKSFLKTYFGVHLFGSVINLSSFILVADKLYKNAPLSKIQLIVLSRSFSSDAYWSPFFVAFAAAITYAPDLSVAIIFPVGLFMAFVAFLVTYIETNVNNGFDKFRGYPINFETLYIPFLLALMVLFANHYNPNLKVILLIALFSLLLTMIILPLKVGLINSIKYLKSHIDNELPKMKNELSLFLVAGMFGVSISTILIGFGVNLPFETFDGVAASILLFIFIILSFVGIHPIISIAIVGNWCDDLDHTLLAVTFLMSWATAVSTSPFSGLNLTIQSRYELNAYEIFKINLPYALKMYIVCVIMIFLLANYLGI